MAVVKKPSGRNQHLLENESEHINPYLDTIAPFEGASLIVCCR